MTNNKEEHQSSSLDHRIIDANLNRLREGIRVIEDIFRYHFNHIEFSSKLKSIRHQIRVPHYNQLLHSRDIVGDVSKDTTKSESQRDSIDDVVVSNFKRTQESARVLEEIYKLSSYTLAQKFKNIRYELYDLEKRYLSVIQ